MRMVNNAMSRRVIFNADDFGASTYGSIEWKCRNYGQKDKEFLRIINLPQHCEQNLSLALSGEGKGILTFTILEEARDAIFLLQTNYRFHCERARELAHDVFSNKVTFPKMLETIMTTMK